MKTPLIENNLESRLVETFGYDVQEIVQKELEKLLKRNSQTKRFQTSIAIRQDQYYFLDVYGMMRGLRKARIIAELIEEAQLAKPQKFRNSTEYSLKKKNCVLGVNLTPSQREKLAALAEQHNQSRSLIIERLIDQKIGSLSKAESKLIKSQLAHLRGELVKQR